MIILVVGPAKSGKTQFLRNLSSLNIPIHTIDDAIPAELIANKDAIRIKVNQLGLVAISLYSYADPSDLDGLIHEWMGEYRVSVLRTIDVINA